MFFYYLRFLLFISLIFSTFAINLQASEDQPSREELRRKIRQKRIELRKKRLPKKHIKPDCTRTLFNAFDLKVISSKEEIGYLQFINYLDLDVLNLPNVCSMVQSYSAMKTQYEFILLTICKYNLNLLRENQETDLFPSSGEDEAIISHVKDIIKCKVGKYRNINQLCQLMNRQRLQAFGDIEVLSNPTLFQYTYKQHSELLLVMVEEYITRTFARLLRSFSEVDIAPDKRRIHIGRELFGRMWAAKYELEILLDRINLLECIKPLAQILYLCMEKNSPARELHSQSIHQHQFLESELIYAKDTLEKLMSTISDYETFLMEDSLNARIQKILQVHTERPNTTHPDIVKSDNETLETLIKLFEQFKEEKHKQYLRNQYLKEQKRIKKIKQHQKKLRKNDLGKEESVDLTATREKLRGSILKRDSLSGINEYSLWFYDKEPFHNFKKEVMEKHKIIEQKNKYKARVKAKRKPKDDSSRREIKIEKDETEKENTTEIIKEIFFISSNHWALLQAILSEEYIGDVEPVKNLFRNALCGFVDETRSGSRTAFVLKHIDTGNVICRTIHIPHGGKLRPEHTQDICLLLQTAGYTIDRIKPPSEEGNSLEKF